MGKLYKIRKNGVSVLVGEFRRLYLKIKELRFCVNAVQATE